MGISPLHALWRVICIGESDQRGVTFCPLKKDFNALLTLHNGEVLLLS
jgi:hypothetical protein